MNTTMNTTNPNTPDPIQAAAMECRRKMYAANENNMDGGLSETDIDAIIATAMRELVAREQLKDIHAIADLREELADAKELLREIRDNEVLPRDEADKFLRDHQPSVLSLLKIENTRLRERVAELEKDNETLRRGAKIAFDQEDHAEKCVESLETQLAAARRDARWLDWLEQFKAFAGVEEWKLFQLDLCTKKYRAAIDAAMKEDGK
jgi:hypothetical protein